MADPKNCDHRAKTEVLDQMHRPWEQLQGESIQAFRAFDYWLTHQEVPVGRAGKQEARSIAGTARALGGRRQFLSAWACRWNWRERARRYDMHHHRLIEAETEIAIRRKVRDMNERHQALARKLQAVAELGAEQLVARIATEEAELKVGDVTKAGDLAAKLERLSIGEATERTEVKDELDLTRLSEEELELYEKLREKAKR